MVITEMTGLTWIYRQRFWFRDEGPDFFLQTPLLLSCWKQNISVVMTLTTALWEFCYWMRWGRTKTCQLFWGSQSSCRFKERLSVFGYRFQVDLVRSASTCSSCASSSSWPHLSELCSLNQHTFAFYDYTNLQVIGQTGSDRLSIDPCRYIIVTLCYTALTYFISKWDNKRAFPWPHEPMTNAETPGCVWIYLLLLSTASGFIMDSCCWWRKMKKISPDVQLTFLFQIFTCCLSRPTPVWQVGVGILSSTGEICTKAAADVTFTDIRV